MFSGRSIFLAGLLILSVQTFAQLPLTRDFEQQATKHRVKGINGWQINQKLSIGTMQTSTIRRGWDFTASLQYTKFHMRPEEALLSVFDIRTGFEDHYQKNKFQYSLSDGRAEMEVYATEKFSENQLVYKSNNPYIGEASMTRKYEYAFTAALVPITSRKVKPWSLVLINAYDIRKDTMKNIGDQPFVEEEGYITNGEDYFTIRAIRVESYRNKKGKEIKILGGPVMTGYEIGRNGKPVSLIDVMHNHVWISNLISADEKLLMASASSAILLKRLQDIEKRESVAGN